MDRTNIWDRTGTKLLDTVYFPIWAVTEQQLLFKGKTYNILKVIHDVDDKSINILTWY